ncbi:MAG: hypothetical protein K940chlam7_02146 [Chlamydiae bacterium]|nr:hypothetical protein [Chlamydiota bacterium]
MNNAGFSISPSDFDWEFYAANFGKESKQPPLIPGKVSKLAKTITKKRNPVKVSCNNCLKRHFKCSERKPCPKCKKLGIECIVRSSRNKSKKSPLPAQTPSPAPFEEPTTLPASPPCVRR